MSNKHDEPKSTNTTMPALGTELHEDKPGPSTPVMQPRPQARTTTPVAPPKSKGQGQKLVMRGHKEFWHHILKLLPANMKKNIGWHDREPELNDVTHCHFFHNVNDSGQPNVHSSITGGHFHEVRLDWGEDEDGNPRLVRSVCGPALKLVMKQVGSNPVPIRKLLPVVYPQHEHLGGDVVDDHTHDLDYLGSELLSVANRKEYRDQNRTEVSAVMTGPSAISQAAALLKTQEAAGGVKPELMKEVERGEATA